MRCFDAGAVLALGPLAAVAAITDAVRGGLDPSTDLPRGSVPLAAGQFLLMPSEDAVAAGVKVVTVAPANPSRGLPRIQAAYLLFDAESLALLAIYDGTALTSLRTPAVSLAAVLPRLPHNPLHVAVCGAGPQAVSHVAALTSLRPPAQVTYLVRDPSRAPGNALALGSSQAARTLAAADLVVCATSARTPLFDSDVLRDDVVVIAVGSHEPDARELDARLLARATVVVEDVATALREAGDVVLAIAEGALEATALLPMAHVITGAVAVPTARPFVFKSVGMSWQDLVIARRVLEASDVDPATRAP